MKSQMSLRGMQATLLAASVLAIGIVSPAQGDTTNPYWSIVERNPFGLKPPPPPPVETPPPPATPTANKITLTGIHSLFGADSVRALLEFEEQEPGAKTKTMRRPILKVGEREGPVEVLAIDIEKNVVKILNAGEQVELTFQKPNPAGSGPTPPGSPGAVLPAPPAAAPRFTGVNPAGSVSPLGSTTPVPAGQPTLVTRASTQDLASSGGVHVFGGSSQPVTPTASPAITSYGGASSTYQGSTAFRSSTAAGGNSAVYGGPGLTLAGADPNANLPMTRPVRTEPPPPNLPDPRLSVRSPEEAYLIVEAMREAQKNDPRAVPLPPTPLTRYLQQEQQGGQAPGQVQPVPQMGQ